ncbi:MAG: Zn-dependent hydrolase [Chloroflexi bacterium]|nr:Zn-dependent hydrolase [Chloroflexota bacterium]
MTQAFSSLRINADRMLDSFNQLALIGGTADSGVDRPSFSEAHLAARAWLRRHIEANGFEFRTDGAGNHSAILSCDDSSAPTLILGSHLDSVPNGGRFDGALGVMAALEVLKTVRENGIKLKVQLEAMDFTDEEGTLVGLLGSAALAGHLSKENLEKPRGGRERLLEGMARAGLSDVSMLSAARKRETLAGYLELHIEQGKRLERSGTDIGIVTAIVGIWSYKLSFIGKADHAGSTTMEDRRDASLGASAFALAAREMVMRDFPNSVVNVGKMDFVPGAFNIVPAQVDAALEFRSPDDEEFKRLDKALLELARSEAARFGLELQTEFLGKHLPSLMDADVRGAFVDSCDVLGLSHMPLPSGAGHDGQSLADLCPVGMIFVPSVDGASHSPREFTKWEDCVNGANVLLQAALRLGNG